MEYNIGMSNGIAIAMKRNKQLKRCAIHASYLLCLTFVWACHCQMLIPWCLPSVGSFRPFLSWLWQGSVAPGLHPGFWDSVSGISRWVQGTLEAMYAGVMTVSFFDLGLLWLHDCVTSASIFLTAQFLMVCGGIIWLPHCVKRWIGRNLCVFLHASIHSFKKYLF